MFSKHLIKILALSSILFLLTNCGKEVSRSPVEPEPNKGKIVLSTFPEKFKIFINNKNTGSITPDSITFLDPGDYFVTLKKEFYKDSIFNVSLTEDETLNLYIDYRANPTMYGQLRITSSPLGAQIFLEDSSIGSNTPATISNLFPGEYSIKLKFAGHRDAQINAIVTSSQLRTYSAVLSDTSVWVDYQTSNSGIQSNILSYVTIDNSWNKWIGTLDKGIIKYDGRTFINYSTGNSQIPSNRINSITADAQNNIWICTDNGLAILQGNSWQIFNMNNSPLISNFINSVEFDQNGVAWIGASSGLYRYDGLSWSVYNDSDLRLWVNDTKIINNKIWMATNFGGVIALENELLIYYPDSIYDYPTNIVTDVAEDLNGQIWFTHNTNASDRNGISVFDGSSFSVFYIGSAQNRLNDIFIDEFDRKWISTSEGLALYSAVNSLQFYNLSNSKLSSTNITSTCLDNSGNLWITTLGGGLNKFKVQ